MSLMNSIRVFVGKTLVFVAATNFLLLPLAEAQSKIKADEAVIKATLKDLGLDKGGKRPTINQVYESLKGKMPEQIRASIAAAVRYHGASAFPDIQSTVVKDKFGQENIRLIFKSEGSQSVTVDYIGQKDRFVRINNTDYSEAEIANITPAIEKAQKRDEVFAKEGQALAKKLQTTKIKGPTLDQVKKMTYNDYISLLSKFQRGLELSFEAISYEASVSKAGKNNYSLELLKFFDLFSVAEAGTKGKADTGTKGKADAGTKGKADAGTRAVTITPTVGDANGPTADVLQCVNAGYIGKSTYGGVKCEFPKEYQKIKEGNYELKATVNFSACAKGENPCNPLLFGVKDDQSPFCVSKNEINEATTRGGSCRRQSNAHFFTENGKPAGPEFLRNNNPSAAERLKFFASLDPSIKDALVIGADGKPKFKDPNTLVFKADATDAKNRLDALTQAYSTIIERGEKAAERACNTKKATKETERQCDIAGSIKELKMDLVAELDKPDVPEVVVTGTSLPSKCEDTKDLTAVCDCGVGKNKDKKVPKKDCVDQEQVPAACVPNGPVPCMCGTAKITDSAQIVKCKPNPNCGAAPGSKCDEPPVFDDCSVTPKPKGCEEPPVVNPPSASEGLCSTPSGKATCKAVGAVALLGLFTWAMFRNTGHANTGTGVYIPPYCPPNGICTTPVPGTSPTPTLPTPPPVRPPEGGSTTPVAPAGLAPKVNK